MKRQVGLNTIIEVFSRLINFVMTLIISRILGANALGIIASAQALSAYIALIGDFGTNNEAIRRISTNNKEVNVVFSIVNIYRIVFSIIVLIGTTLFWFIGDKTNPILVLFIIFSLIVTFFPNYIFFGLKLFKYNGIMNMINSTLTVIIFVCFLTFQKSVIYFPISLIGGAFFALLFSMLIVLKNYAKFNLPTAMEFKEFIKTSFVLGFTIIFARIYYDFDIIMLNIMKDKESVGLYSAAFKIIQILWFLPQMYVTYALPVVSEIITKSKQNELKLGTYLNKILSYSLVFIMPISIIAMNYSDFLLITLFGNDFKGAGPTLSILLFAFIIMCFKTIFGNIMIANRREKTLVKLSIFGSVFNICLNIILIPYIGIEGAAISTLLTESVLFVTEAQSVRKNFKFDFPVRTLFKVFLSLSVNIIIFHYFSLNLVLELVIMLLMYIFLLFILKETVIIQCFKFLKKWSGKNVR